MAGPLEPWRRPLTRGDSLLDGYPHSVQPIDPSSAGRLWRAVPGLRAGALLVGVDMYVYPSVSTARVAAPYQYPLDAADTWLVALPRCGASWAQEMVWLIANNCDWEGARSELSPVRWDFLELKYQCLQTPAVAKELWWRMAKASVLNLPRMLWAAARTAWYKTHHSPRFVRTHMPFSMLPPKLLDVCKVIYVARNPKDVLVSYYHHHKVLRTYGCDGTFEEFFDLFISNKLIQMSFFPHVHEAWEKRHHPHLLFIFFEEMEMNLRAVIRRVADFLRKELSDPEVELLHRHLSFESMSKNRFVQLEWLRDQGLMSDTHSLYRSGKTGGWKSFFSPEMNDRMDAWIVENLRGSDLRFVTELD